MGIEITTEPIDVSVDGTVFWLQGDPSNNPAWDKLMVTNVVIGDPKKRQAAHKAMVEALAAMAATPEDAETLRKVFDTDTEAGTITLDRTVKAYIREVTGFPTQPPPTSTGG